MPYQTEYPFWEKLYVAIVHATPTEYIIYGSILTIIICIVYTKSRSIYSNLLHTRNTRARIHSTLLEAQGQRQVFELHVQNNSNKIIASTILQVIEQDSLTFESMGHVSNLLINVPVDVFFRVRDALTTNYYKCRCTILDVAAMSMNRVRVKVSMPNDFAEGQKRIFFRVKPSPDSIRALLLWEQPLDKPIPRSTAEIGKPLFSFTNLEDVETQNQEESPLMPVEDISGSGIGLSIPKMENIEQIQKGMQILCLMVYKENGSERRNVKFWCIGKVVNIRDSATSKDLLVLGLEFSNWALMEPQQKEIHWFHNSSSNGVSPIIQWVRKMDLEKSKRMS